MSNVELFQYRHPAEEFGAYCDGKFSPIPVRFVGLGHTSSPRGQGWPVYRCEVCRDEIFISDRERRESTPAPVSHGAKKR